MIPFIRPASEEEVEKIKPTADLTASSAVWSWPSDKGDSDIAVLRQCMEIDPVNFGASAGKQRKHMFFWALCNMLKATGAREIYFNIDAEGSEDYTAVLEKMGATKTTIKPQFRFKLAL